MPEQFSLFDVTTQPAGRAVTQAAELLPPQAVQIRNLVGEESLIRIVQRWGGTHLDWPKTIALIDTSNVVAAVAEEVGIANARILATHFIGTRLHVPKLHRALLQVRNRLIKVATDREPVPAVARRFHLTERQVFNIIKTPD